LVLPLLLILVVLAGITSSCGTFGFIGTFGICFIAGTSCTVDTAGISVNSGYGNGTASTRLNNF